MTWQATLAYQPGDEAGDEASLVVADSSGQVLYRSGLAARPRPLDEPPAVVDCLLELADGELTAAGWVRGDRPWTAPDGSAGTRSAVVGARPPVPLARQEQQALDAVRRLTGMARGPVTAAALVPLVAPRWQAAAALMRRLVLAGHVRAVGWTTNDRISRTLYAPVGSTWAPDGLDEEP